VGRVPHRPARLVPPAPLMPRGGKRTERAASAACSGVSMCGMRTPAAGGLVFGQDADAALGVADRMDTGSVGINFFASNRAAPFGGRHDSGLGTEYGIEGLNAYLRYKSIHRRA
jgi:aldehyde dehydrogenase (NAD+)